MEDKAGPPISGFMVSGRSEVIELTPALPEGLPERISPLSVRLRVDDALSAAPTGAAVFVTTEGRTCLHEQAFFRIDMQFGTVSSQPGFKLYSNPGN